MSLLLILLSLRAFAQDVIVEAASINEEMIEPSRSNSIITEQEIKAKKARTVADLLREIPGVEIVRQGGIGQTTSIFIRGARSEDTLVLIDGMEANDAMSPASGFDFSSLSPDNILRIEIYRGPQSVRFGAGALGGVINIITKEGAGLPVATYSLEGGSYHTGRASLGHSAKLGALNYSFSFDHIQTKGFSAASESAGNSEDDGTKVKSASSKIGWTPNASTKVESFVRYTEARADIDQQGGVGGDDPNDTTVGKQLVTGVSASQRFFDDRLKSKIGIYFSEVNRDGKNDPDSVSATKSEDHFLSENRKVQSDNEVALGEEHTLRLDLQWRDETGTSHSIYSGTPSKVGRREQAVAGESLTYLFENETWFYDVGARADQSDEVGSISSYRASLGRELFEKKTKVFVTYGTGFKLPSLYQLYSIYGDRSLREEESKTVEATVEQKLGTSLVSLTAFQNEFTDLVDFNTATSKYFNIAKAKTKGFELQSTTHLEKEVDLKAGYTYLEAEDESTGQDLVRRPQHTFTFAGQFRADRLEGIVQYQFRGARTDIDPNSFARIQSASYDVWNLGGSYQFAPTFKTTARIENIFDKKYEEVAGYGTPGRSFYIGIAGEI